MVVATRALFAACGLVLVSSLVLGGGTSAGFLSDAVLQLIALPPCLICVWYLLSSRIDGSMRWPLIFALSMMLLPLLQLVPLPPELWTALPNRGALAESYRLLHQDLPWLPISVAPHATWASALSLLPPIAIFFSMALLELRERRLLSILVLVIAVLSVFVGLSQVAQGANSWLRFFEFTNLSEAVGFFANRNHFAAFLYASLLFAAAWAVEAASRFEAGRRRTDTLSIVALVASFTVLVLLVAAQAMARSRAGLGLTIVALFGALALALTDRRTTAGLTPTRLLTGATTLAVLFAVQYALYRILQRFEADPLEDARIVFARNTFSAAKAYMPFGSGMGTFVPVYASIEKPEDALIDTYANHAHNDVLELLLEAGAPGLILMTVFVVWLVRACARVWRSDAPGKDLDRLLARAATITVALIILHSVFDYPLRTGAMLAILAFACGLLVEPAPQSAAQHRQDYERMPWDDLSAAATGPPPTAESPRQDAPPQTPSGGRWGEDVSWPQEWRAPDQPQRPRAGAKPSETKKPTGPGNQ